MYIILNNLPKISLNEWYSSTHWSKRVKIKYTYELIIKSYKVDYIFQFKSKPLDCTNCVAMVKLIEDIIFKDDSYKIVQEISIQSIKGKEDKVIIDCIYQDN